MSELTLALERISTWYQEKESRAIFQPGLSRSEIDNLVKDLQFFVPDELYELYQWCNGSSKVPIILNQRWLLPLEEAISLRQDSGGLNYGEDTDVLPDDPSWLPIFKLHYDHVFYVLALGEQEKNRIRNYDSEFKDYGVHYENLTNLLLHSAEWLESVEYQENANGEMYSGIDAPLQVKYRLRESIHPDDLKRAGISP
jgi:cell wall assembly regulator SMI1